MNARPLVLALLAAPALAACGADASAARPLSTAERYNQELRARAATARYAAHAPTPEFAAAFTLRERATLAAPDPEALPTVCAAAGDAVYLAARRSGVLHRWTPGDGSVAPLAVPAGARPEDPGALAWDADAGVLRVLDQDGRRLLAFGPDGAPRGETFLNAGQTGFALALLPGGDVLVGGERWEAEGRATLLAVYAPDGRFRRAFLPMGSGDDHGEAEEAHMHTPVAVAVEPGGRVVAAEPTSYLLRRLDAEGREAAAFGEEPRGYLPPTPRPDPLPALPEIEAWLASWTPLLFVHAGGGLVFSGLEVRRPAAGFQLDVYDAAGRRVAEGLRSDARPACGEGRSLVFLRRAGATSVELLRYEYVGPDIPRTKEVEG